MDKTKFNVEGKTITMERVFSAPIERVWKAFTTEELNEWWGPKGWETTSKELDFRSGGKWHYCMKCVDENQGEWFGQESWGLATYTEVEDQKSYTYTDAFSDAEGNVNSEMPVMTIKVQFESTPDGKTKVTSTSELQSEEEVKKLVETGMEQGAIETWERLEEKLSKES